MAEALDVSLDYLVGNAKAAVIDKKTLKRLEDIEQLPETDKEHIF